MKLKCLIVDDEPPAHKVIEKYISLHGSLEHVGNFYNAIEALSFLATNKVDVIFLDINMPELSGMEMLRTMDKPPAVILTTAYSEYALESYDLGVVDYLMKPIRLDRFLKAVQKILKMRFAHAEDNSVISSKKLESIFIKVDGAQQKIILKDLDFIESRGNFIQLNLGEQRYLTAETLTNFDKRLERTGFLRIHKSYIINIEKVTRIQGNIVELGVKTLPIGNSYKQVVLRKLGM